MNPDAIFEIKQHITGVEVWLKFAPELEHQWVSDAPWWLDAEAYAKGQLWEQYGQEIIEYILASRQEGMS